MNEIEYFKSIYLRNLDTNLNVHHAFKNLYPRNLDNKLNGHHTFKNIYPSNLDIKLNIHHAFKMSWFKMNVVAYLKAEMLCMDLSV